MTKMPKWRRKKPPSAIPSWARPAAVSCLRSALVTVLALCCLLILLAGSRQGLAAELVSAKVTGPPSEASPKLAKATAATSSSTSPAITKRFQKNKSQEQPVRTANRSTSPTVQRPSIERKLQVAQVAARQRNTAAVNGNDKSSNLWRPSSFHLLQQQQQQDQDQDQAARASQSSAHGDGDSERRRVKQNVAAAAAEFQDSLQASITPRVGSIRAPVGSNTILKCLISAQSDNFTRPFKIRWSRFMYDENVYEQIESSTGFDEPAGAGESGGVPAQSNDQLAGGGGARGLWRGRREQVAEARHDDSDGDGADEPPPPPSIAGTLVDRQQQLRDFLARSRQETNVISSILIEATLAIDQVKPSDNASYFCTATASGGPSAAGLAPEAGLAGGFSGGNWQNQARIDLVALSRPVVRLDQVKPARDSKSALVTWTVVSDGNTPIVRTILMVRNDSRLQLPAEQWLTMAAGASSTVIDDERNQWVRIEISGEGSPVQSTTTATTSSLAATIAAAMLNDSQPFADMDVTSIARPPPSDARPGSHAAPAGARWQQSQRRGQRKQRSLVLSPLLPGVAYKLKLAAINDMGQSEWSKLELTTPNEIPAQISDIVPLSTTNDSITIGWRRPNYDQAKTIRYELQLFDLNRTLTLDANTNTNLSQSGPARTAFMFHFVNLNPGTDYHFQIRACSRAGCSAYSSPKLLVSTQDGEPGEPLDVELACQLSTGGAAAGPTNLLTVSWLPPVNVRGRLLNYSVHIESSATYMNQSGQWTSDQWRTVMDTGDSLALSLEASNLLQPNTNYSVRVCANNRLKRCGRLSETTSRSQCSTPAELPGELPASLQLSLGRPRAKSGAELLFRAADQQPPQQVETLVLELPLMSARNGTIDCVQVVLVRLPDSFEGSRRSLGDLLPGEPAELNVRDYLEWAQAERGSGEPVAYLAEELSLANQMSDSADEIARGTKQIYLGDGHQLNCNSVWARFKRARASAATATSSIDAPGREPDTSEEKKSVPRPRDGPLLAQTYYTGFLRLIQLRPAAPPAPEEGLRNRSVVRTLRHADTSGLELVAKFSGYFSPVKTGDNVPEVPISSLLASDQDFDESRWDENSAADGTPNGASPTAATANNSICVHKYVQLIQTKLSLTNATCLAVSKFASSTRRRAAHLFDVASSYLSERLRFALGRPSYASLDPTGKQQQQQHHIATMQPLEIGLILIMSTLFVMFLIYLLLLPSRLSRRRKRKVRLKLKRHENSVLQQQQQQGQAYQPDDQMQRQQEDQTGGFVRSAVQLKQQQQLVNDPDSQQQQQQQQQQSNALASSLGYQPVLHQADVHQHHSPRTHNQGCGTLQRPSHECPVHSSPRAQVAFAGDAERRDPQAEERRQSVHVCQPSNDVRNQRSRKRDEDDDNSIYYQGRCQPSQHHYRSAHQLNGHVEPDDDEVPHHSQHQHHHHHHHHHNQQQEVDQRTRTVVTRRHQPLANDELVPSEHDRVYRTMHHQGDPDHNHHHHHQHQAHQAHSSYQRQQQQQQHEGQLYGGRLHSGGGYRSNVPTGSATLGRSGQLVGPAQSDWSQTMTRQQSGVLALAKKINKSIPLSLFQFVMEMRLKNNWLREEYEQLPRTALNLQQHQHHHQQQQQPVTTGYDQATNLQEDGRHIKLRPQLIVSRDDSVSALIIGNNHYDASLIKLQVPVASMGGAASAAAGLACGGVSTIEKQLICAKSPTDANTVWDFWRLIYEKEVSTLVMLTPNEDTHSGELRCAQYWPTCDNEITTILSPRNESVASSKWPLAKFKICQETLSEPESEFVIRRLTLLVMATKPSDNEHLANGSSPPSPPQPVAEAKQSPDDRQAPAKFVANGTGTGANVQSPNDQNAAHTNTDADQFPPPPAETLPEAVGGPDETDAVQENSPEQDDEVIVERNLLHFQFLHWNASSSSNQMKLIKFTELVNEQHAQLMQQQASPCANWQRNGPQNPILIHCANGIGRSGLFAALSFVIEDLSFKLATMSSAHLARTGQQQQQVMAKLNLFQLVTRLRNNRDMLLSPYRFYELLYQLTAKCIPAHISNNHDQQQQQ